MGSEMCIRDSWETHRQLTCRPWAILWDRSTEESVMGPTSFHRTKTVRGMHLVLRFRTQASAALPLRAPSARASTAASAKPHSTHDDLKHALVNAGVVSEVTVDSGPRGLGLRVPAPQQQSHTSLRPSREGAVPNQGRPEIPAVDGQRTLLRVPTELCLSLNLPGAF